MKVLIISGTILPLAADRLQMCPSGAAYIAGAVRNAGHSTEVFDCYVEENLTAELKEKLFQFNPDVVGISITIVATDILDEESDFGTKYSLRIVYKTRLCLQMYLQRNNKWIKN